MSAVSEIDLLPRRYQEEIFVQAQAGNVIAALDTGTGKTFIGLLLLKWICTTRPNSKAIFFAPKVALVQQQSRFIESHSTLRVAQLSGENVIDFAKRERWEAMLRGHDVFVMTPQILVNLITHSIWTFSLLIFDECHHARKNHPYSQIMREYSETRMDLRPKIFGMTASPVWDVKKVQKSLADLERTLDAKVVAVRANAEELISHAPTAVEVIKHFSPSPLHYDGFPVPTLWDYISVFEKIFLDSGVNWDEITRRYNITLSNLGPHSASDFLRLEIGHRLLTLRKEKADAIMIDDDSSHHLFEASLAADMIAMQDILDETAVPLSVPLAWCSPKVRSLVEVLLEHDSASFQGIIFVEQRQVAVCLARLLPLIPPLEGKVRCAALLGSDKSSDGGGTSAERSSQDSIEAFRQGRIIIIVATSVAEEGLDFPACDVVVRFDELQHMIGYVQSRGRARRKASKFVVMVNESDQAQLARYQSFSNQDPLLKSIYRTRHEEDSEVEDEDDEEVDPSERERYIVPGTGATLTYDNCISLLVRLCSLIPHEPFCDGYAPVYSGEFQSTVRLPAALPLERQDLVFQGALKRTKKEAKRAAAFRAVKRLHELEVFDNFLLPVSDAPQADQDSQGAPLIKVGSVPVTMEVAVKDPWTAIKDLWIHPIRVNDTLVAGLVTGSRLPAVSVPLPTGETLALGDAEPVDLESCHGSRQLMCKFMRDCVYLRISGSPIKEPCALYVVPLTDGGQPDFAMMESLFSYSSDWSTIPGTNFTDIVVTNSLMYGRHFFLKSIRQDLSPLSVPSANDCPRAVDFPSYHEYWLSRCSGRKQQPLVPTEGPLLELVRYSRLQHPDDSEPRTILPQLGSRWIRLPVAFRDLLAHIPNLYFRITDVYRAQQARHSLRLPPIDLDTLVEALTLPCVAAGVNNQRLETLGDAVLQLCTTVHLFNRYPNHHEGQLTLMRKNSVCNRFLLSRAKDISLEAFLTCESRNISTWHGHMQRARSDELAGSRLVKRKFPRRSLQDCMEAILGGSFVTGGINMALQCGSALGVDFGGCIPWECRFHLRETSPVSFTFSRLEGALGYQFRSQRLLVEALTHPSFDNQSTSSYQRLEFLGDAVLELVVVYYLYRKFPVANSGQLSWARSRVVCAPALATVGVQRLQLHQSLLVNNFELSREMERHVPLLQACSPLETVQRGWRYDPPKALSDVFESVIGAVFVDSGYDYQRTAMVVEHVMSDVLDVLSPAVQRDPISELMEWAAAAGCLSPKRILFKKSVTDGGARHTVTVIAHDVVIAGPIHSHSGLIAKNLAAERAMHVLNDSANAKSIGRLCDCRNRSDLMILDPANLEQEEEGDQDEFIDEMV